MNRVMLNTPLAQANTLLKTIAREAQILSTEELTKALEQYGCGYDDWNALFEYEKPRIIFKALAARTKEA